jgi:tetratricopeptide (TPR) repeat protein
MRKSVRIAPGVRVNFSKSGIGYSAGVKGYRVTKRADGRTQSTTSLPGTGLSYVTTSGSARSRAASARPAQVPPAPRPAKPGWFAPKGEKLLYEAIRQQDAAAMERVAQGHPDQALAAATVAGLLKLAAGENDRAIALLQWVFDQHKDPAVDPFMQKYVATVFRLEIAPGATAELGADRNAVGLALGELYQDAGDRTRAIDVVEQLEPTTVAAVSLSEMYVEEARWDDVIELTDGIANEDDLTALLCTYRGIALREKELCEAARGAFKEALKSKKRDAVVRHRALLERARTYEAEGKRAMAKKDLERIMAEDSTSPGLSEALAELG